MKLTGHHRKAGFGIGLAVLACAACCAPIILAAIAGMATMTSAGIGWMLGGEIVALALLAAGGLAAVLVWRRWRAAQACGCGGEGCSPSRSCTLPRNP
jgi:hypothetical protein